MLPLVSRSLVVPKAGTTAERCKRVDWKDDSHNIHLLTILQIHLSETPEMTVSMFFSSMLTLPARKSAGIEL